MPRGLAEILVVIGLLAAGAWGDQLDPGDPTRIADPDTPRAASDAWEPLFNETAPPEARQQAASRLAEAILDSAAEQNIDLTAAADRALGGGSPGAASLLLAELARAPGLPAWLDVPLSSNLYATGATPGVTNALARTRTRRAAAVLIEAAVADPNPTLFAALRTLAGVEPTRDASAHEWSEWLASMPEDPAAWYRALTASLADSVRLAEGRADERSTRAAELARRLHLALAPSERPAFIAELIRDPDAQLSAIGTGLAMRSASEVDPAPLADAAVELLGRSDPDARMRAAQLLDRLALDASAPAVLDALAWESDPRAAEALLTAASRWPDSRVVTPALRWIEVQSVRPAAARVLWSLERVGLLPREDVDRALAPLRAAAATSLSPSGVRLLAQLAPDQHARLSTLLASQDARVRLNAAEALADFPTFVDDLLDAASVSPDVCPAAARATREHGPTAERYQRLRAMATDAPDWASQLAQVAARLPDRDILMLVRDTEPLDERERLLAALADPARTAPPSPERTEGLVMLAEVRLTLRRPDGAIEALDLLNTVALAPTQTTRTTVARLDALIRLGRLDDASALGASVDQWLTAMEHAASAGVDLGPAMERLRASDLSDAETARLNALQPTTPPGGG